MLSFFLAATLALINASPAAQSPLRIEQAWIREAPPVADVMAGYANLCNDDSDAIVITELGSAKFARVEMHATVETAASVTMERLDEVRIPSGECVNFAPGGKHFMLFKPQSALRTGDDAEIAITLADGRTFTVAFPVKRADDMPESRHGHHHGH